MLPLATMRTPIFAIPHLLGIPAPEHLVHESIIVGRLVARVDAFESIPVLGKDLFEDIPVLRGCCNHQGAPSRSIEVCSAAFLPHLTGSIHPIIGLLRGTLTHLSSL